MTRRTPCRGRLWVETGFTRCSPLVRSTRTRRSGERDAIYQWFQSCAAQPGEAIDVRILVVEDDSRAARFLRQGLEEEGHTVDVAEDGEAGARHGHGTTYDIMVVDVQLPGMS